MGWPLAGQLRLWRHGSWFLPFLSLHGTAGREHPGQSWPTIISPVLLANESRACVREEARVEGLVILGKA